MFFSCLDASAFGQIERIHLMLNGEGGSMMRKTHTPPPGQWIPGAGREDGAEDSPVGTLMA